MTVLFATRYSHEKNVSFSSENDQMKTFLFDGEKKKNVPNLFLPFLLARHLLCEGKPPSAFFIEKKIF
jgi:hypothetical protein